MDYFKMIVVKVSTGNVSNYSSPCSLSSQHKDWSYTPVKKNKENTNTSIYLLFNFAHKTQCHIRVFVEIFNALTRIRS